MHVDTAFIILDDEWMRAMYHLEEKEDSKGSLWISVNVPLRRTQPRKAEVGFQLTPLEDWKKGTQTHQPVIEYRAPREVPSYHQIHNPEPKIRKLFLAVLKLVLNFQNPHM